MKSLSLEELYEKLHKQILLTQAYTDLDGLFFIIKSCRLKPYKYFKNKSNRIILYRKWFDEFGASLLIDNKKEISIVCNDLTIDQSMIPCSDMYFGLEIHNIAKISKLAYIQIGFDETLNSKCYLVAFLGIDNYFRTFMFDGSWKQISTLYLGINLLQIIANRTNIDSYIELYSNEPVPMINSKQFLTTLPVCSDFITQVSMNNDELINALTKGR